MSVLDLLITNAQVYDGLDPEPQFLDVGIQGDRIAFLGEDSPAPALQTFDADGRLLCPGFIDTQGSSALGFLLPRASDHKLAQGVTTEIVGTGGLSPGPLTERNVAELRQEARTLGLEVQWSSLGQWLQIIEHRGLQQNVGCLVGHSTVRAGVLADWQQVTGDDLEAMKGLVARSCQEGALGLSSGLHEAPGTFADTAEVVALARVAAEHGGVFTAYLRDERQGLDDALEEAIQVAREADLPVLVHELKAAERANWGKLSDIVRSLEEARGQGLRLEFEVQPYASEMRLLRTYLPKECTAHGTDGLAQRLERSDWRQYALQWLAYRGLDFDRMVLATDSLPRHQARGMSISQIAAAAGREPAQMVVDLVLTDPEAWVINHCLSEDDVDAAVLCKESIIGSGSWRVPVNAPRPIGEPHPSTFAAFTRYLERFPIEGLLTFGNALAKITSFPADLLGLSERGRIQVGAFADLVLINPNEVKALASYEEPRQLSRGTEKVWVNGALVFDRGQALEARPGRVLRRGVATRPAA